MDYQNALLHPQSEIFNGLPPETWMIVFLFLVDTPSFFAVRLTCKNFQGIVEAIGRHLERRFRSTHRVRVPVEVERWSRWGVDSGTVTVHHMRRLNFDICNYEEHDIVCTNRVCEQCNLVTDLSKKTFWDMSKWKVVNKSKQVVFTNLKREQTPVVSTLTEPVSPKYYPTVKKPVKVVTEQKRKDKDKYWKKRNRLNVVMLGRARDERRSEPCSLYCHNCGQVEEQFFVDGREHRWCYCDEYREWEREMEWEEQHWADTFYCSSDDGYFDPFYEEFW